MDIVVQQMTVFEGFLLGLVQGVTEFLPVSSSGHLILARELLHTGPVPLLFDVLLHLATLCAIFLQYRSRILDLAVACLRRLAGKPSVGDLEQVRLVFSLMAATMVTIVVALPMRYSGISSESVASVSLLMLVTALLLFLSRKAQGKTSLSAIGWKQTVLIGFAQGIGTLAGISRSGITISTGLYSGLDRKSAGEYAFLLAIPAILGALVLAGLEQSVGDLSIELLPMLAGCIAAFVSGLASLKLLLWVVGKARLWYFSLYLVVVAIIGLASSFL